MRVLLANKFLYPKGGAEIVCLGLAAQLKARGHETWLFGMSDERNVAGPDADCYPANIDYHAERGLWQKVREGLRSIYSREAKRGMARVMWSGWLEAFGAWRWWFVIWFGSLILFLLLLYSYMGHRQAAILYAYPFIIGAAHPLPKTNALLLPFGRRSPAAAGGQGQEGQGGQDRSGCSHQGHLNKSAGGQARAGPWFIS